MGRNHLINFEVLRINYFKVSVAVNHKRFFMVSNLVCACWYLEIIEFSKNKLRNIFRLICSFNRIVLAKEIFLSKKSLAMLYFESDSICSCNDKYRICWSKETKHSNKVLKVLTLQGVTPQIGQTNSNNSSGNCLIEFDHFVWLHLEGLKSPEGLLIPVVITNKREINIYLLQNLLYHNKICVFYILVFLHCQLVCLYFFPKMSCLSTFFINKKEIIDRIQAFAFDCS